MFMCSLLEVWKADEQVERGHSHPDEQARPFIIFKNQTPIEERGNLFGKTFNLSTDFISLRQVLLLNRSELDFKVFSYKSYL